MHRKVSGWWKLRRSSEKQNVIAEISPFFLLKFLEVYLKFFFLKFLLLLAAKSAIKKKNIVKKILTKWTLKLARKRRTSVFLFLETLKYFSKRSEGKKNNKKYVKKKKMNWLSDKVSKFYRGKFFGVWIGEHLSCCERL